MQIKNNHERYGLIAITLHWLVALVVPSMFALGLWMVSLTYYNPWYNQGPFIHKGVGVVLLLMTLFRLLWRFISPPPPALSRAGSFEHFAARAAHILLYLLIVLMFISGYLISTADGAPLEVFGLFDIPALIDGFEDQEDIAGDSHLLLAYGLIGLAGLHALAALKHHFFDKDSTLLRMLGR
ncbi:MAG: cytochrome b [Candidatus Polarisedimenticolaceae bacterium]|nr:cytochrome b [Candidatus Polarisedimenticolaceae bacterium]